MVKLFSPPYGDSTDITANNILFCKFSPPYGDSTYDSEKVTNVLTLSSPCGDKLQWLVLLVDEEGRMLSSPCGDKLQSERIQRTGKAYEVIVPLRG